jgi:hypothetical protein
VGGTQALHVIGARAKRIDAGETERVGGSRRSTVGADDERTIAAGDGPAGGHDAVRVGARAVARIKGTRTVAVAGPEQGRLLNGRAIQVRGHAALRVTGTRKLAADTELRVKQGGSWVGLVNGDAIVAPQQRLGLSNTGGAVVMEPSQGAALRVAAGLQLICGAAQISIDDSQIAVKAPAIVVRGALGEVSLDRLGAATRGGKVTSSAVMLNELKGARVVFSDTPGVLAPLSTHRVRVQRQASAETPLHLAAASEDPVTLTITFLEDDLSPADGIEVRLTTPAGQVVVGTTDRDGVLTASLPAGVPSVDVALFPEGREREGELT